MSRPVDVSQAQDQLLAGLRLRRRNPHRWLGKPRTWLKRQALGFPRQLETAFDLYRIRQRLHHQFKGLKAEYESVREYYDSDEEPRNEPRPLELEVAEEIDQAVDTIEKWLMTSEKPRA